MRPRCLLLAVAFLAAAVPVARTDDDKPALPEGNWILSSTLAFGDSPACLIKSEVKDGKPTLTVLAAPPSIEAKISEVKTEKGLSFKLSTVQTVKDKSGKERKFPGSRVFVAAPGSSGKVILGSLGTDDFNTRAKLTATAEEKLGALVRSPASETMQTIQGLNQKVAIAMNKAGREKDKEKRKELRAEADKLDKDADSKLPDLYRGVVKEFPESAAAADCATSLIGTSANAKVTAEEAKSFATLILKQAAMYGPRYAGNTAARLGNTLVRQKGLEAVGLLPLEPIVKAMKETDPLEFQFDILSNYQKSLESAGRADDRKTVDARLAKLDLALDKDYEEKVPSFKPKAFDGRENASRVAVMELFTGAQCPPCVAADVAFDALAKAYQPKDVLLIQYHVHIPGPDPLANPATLARWDYYTELFPYDPDTGTGMGGAPSTLFNGKALAGGGGPMANAEPKYKEYRKILDSLLEKTSEIKLNGTATRDGDKISLAVDVKGAKDGLKLRLLLVEDTIKYVGGNRIRFHHQVVRAMPGGADGVAIKGEASLKHTATADVAAIRKELTSYLDDYAANERPFPYPKVRPLDMKNLKVIALIQDDKTGEIVQAVHLEIGSK